MQEDIATCPNVIMVANGDSFTGVVPLTNLKDVHQPPEISTTLSFRAIILHICGTWTLYRPFIGIIYQFCPYTTKSMSKHQGSSHIIQNMVFQQSIFIHENIRTVNLQTHAATSSDVLSGISCHLNVLLQKEIYVC